MNQRLKRTVLSGRFTLNQDQTLLKGFDIRDYWVYQQCFKIHTPLDSLLNPFNLNELIIVNICRERNCDVNCKEKVNVDKLFNKDFLLKL